MKQTAVNLQRMQMMLHTDDKTTVEAAGTDAAESVAYIDNAPIKAVKIDTKTKRKALKQDG
ncbi:MAG: hypothetical protein ACLRZ2_02080 [Veillonella sp.]